MKAVVFKKYGSINNLRVEEVDKPEPKENEVRLKVHGASINQGDFEIIRGKFSSRLHTGLFRPNINTPGIDVSGTIDAIGPHATGSVTGEEVYANLSTHGYGGFAEYVCVPQSSIALKPENLSFVEAAAVPMAGITAFQGLIDYGELLSYRSVMIIGAAGGVGHFALQIAKNYNLQVTGVTRQENHDFVKRLGADRVIGFDEVDFSNINNHYELIFDTVANKSAYKFRKMLTRDGKYVACAFSPSAFISSPFGGILNNRKVITFKVRPTSKDLTTLSKMIERGNVTPNVDRVYSMEKTVDALKYAASENVNGKVVIEVFG